MHFFTAAIVFVIALNTCALGQSTGTDTAFVHVARHKAVALYEQSVRHQAHVYEGGEYINHDPRIKMHPYYLIDSLQTGTVDYKGIQYRDVRMLYDIVRDELAIQPPDGGYRLRLQTDKIAGFSMGAHQFARIVGDSVAGVRTGFYEIIYNGKVKALAKRLKTVYEDISGGSYKADYLQKDRFLVQKDGAFYEVKTKRSLLDLFPDQAKTLRKYIRANHLKFKDEEREQAITQVTRRYEELTH